MKQNINLFNNFLLCTILCFLCNVQIFASEHDIAVEDSSKMDSSLVAMLDSTDVYLLTCTPHDEVYSLYGHTAIRVNNRLAGEDYTINYGVFDTRVDFFVPRFVFGLTDYMMGMFSFHDFLMEYKYYGSAVFQQHINFSRSEKLRFLRIIAENARPENVVYRYNFFYNNCTDKARDVLLASFEGNVEWQRTGYQVGKQSFRSLVHAKTESNQWARFGNDLLLGVLADCDASFDERQFLPEILMGDMQVAKIRYADGNVKKLVDEKITVLESGVPYHDDGFEMPLSPDTCCMILVCAIMAFLIFERVHKRTYPWIEYAICCLYAIPGIVIFLMIFSQHPTVNINFQILLLNPFLFLLGFPKFRWRYKWHVVSICILLFFIGRIFQTYASGIFYLAWPLLILVSNKNSKNIEKY